MEELNAAHTRARAEKLQARQLEREANQRELVRQQEEGKSH